MERGKKSQEVKREAERGKKSQGVKREARDVESDMFGLGTGLV